MASSLAAKASAAAASLSASSGPVPSRVESNVVPGMSSNPGVGRGAGVGGASAVAGVSTGQRGAAGEDPLSTAASVLTSISNSLPVAYTPTTHRVSKAKKGKKVHVCEHEGCGKVSDLEIYLLPGDSISFSLTISCVRMFKNPLLR